MTADDIGSGSLEEKSMRAARIAVPMGLAAALGVASVLLLPRGFEARQLLASRYDPVALADHAIAGTFNAEGAGREIEAALAADDADLARSFLDLARDRGVAVDAGLADRVAQANSGVAGARRSLESFARGLVTGEPGDLSALAGTALGDLFVFGDIRDALRESARLVSGQQADELVLALAAAGLAVTAGTYATGGLGAPARAGLTVVKAARRTGRLGSGLAAWLTRSVREVVDWAALPRAIGAVRIGGPALPLRAAREAVKVEKARDVVRLVADVGRVQAKAGTQAAFDAMKLAEGPRDMARVARLAAAKGGKTRAILRLAGRAAIWLTLGAFDLAMWMFWTLLALLGFVSSLKRAAERITERYCARRKARRARARQQRAVEPCRRRASADLHAVGRSDAPGVASSRPAWPAQSEPEAQALSPMDGSSGLRAAAAAG
jgi:hypothetical protein